MEMLINPKRIYVTFSFKVKIKMFIINEVQEHNYLFTIIIGF